MTVEYYGRGLRFPVQLGLAGLGQSAGVAKVEESIRVLLGTQYGERVMRPRYGCNLGSLTFAPNTTSTANLARYYVEEALTRWEPRIELVSVAVDNVVGPGEPGGVLLITITYRLRATQDVHTLVHPFALEGTP
jgi:phage baseplate assembly protein W